MTKKPNRYWSDEEDILLRKLYIAGLTWKGIAARFDNCDWRQASSHANRIGIIKKHRRRKKTERVNLEISGELLNAWLPHLKESGLSRSAYIRRLLRKDIAYKNRPKRQAQT